MSLLDVVCIENSWLLQLPSVKPLILLVVDFIHFSKSAVTNSSLLEHSVSLFHPKRLSTGFTPAIKLEFKGPSSVEVQAPVFQMPAAIKDKVGEPDEPGRSSAPPVEDQQQVPQPVKPSSPPPRPQPLYSHEVGTMHTTPSRLVNCEGMKMWF